MRPDMFAIRFLGSGPFSCAGGRDKVVVWNGKEIDDDNHVGGGCLCDESFVCSLGNDDA